MWLKIGGLALVAGLLGLLIWLYGGARYNAGAADERTEWQAKVSKAEREKLAAYQAGVASVQAADDRYITNTREVVVPVTRTIIEREAAYAATPEGSTLCLAPARVGLLAQTRSALFHPAAASGSPGVAGPVRSDAPGAEPRRVDE